MRTILKISAFGLLLTFFFSAAHPSPALSQGEKPKTFLVKYLRSIDARVSGLDLEGVRDIFIDSGHNELYALDNGNGRVVITDLEGTFLYQFYYRHSRIGSNPTDIAVADDGAIYVAEVKRVVVLEYNGRYREDLDLSTLPGRDKTAIQSMEIEGDNLYLADSGNDRVAVVDLRGKFITEFGWEMGHNIYLSLDDEGIYVMDPAIFSVFRLDRSGKVLSRFGQVSGLAGGFSMMVDFAVDRKNGRVIVVDTNRTAAIIFNRNGDFLFEFGGPQVFTWPSTLAVDAAGRLYVYDGSRTIRVFEIIEESAETASEEPPVGTVAGPEGGSGKPENGADVPITVPPPAEEK